MANSTSESLYLLSIELASAPSSLRAVLELGRDDVEHWLKRAKAAGAPLAIVCGPDSVDLYSSEAGRRAAFKPLLESLWALGRNLDGFERIRTREACGRAARHRTLSQALLDLFQLASSTADRSRAETELGAPYSTRASRQIEAMSAERIMEEEVTAFRVAAANDEAARSSVPAPRESLPPYSAHEPSSCVRMRVAPFSMVPVSKRHSG